MVAFTLPLLTVFYQGQVAAGAQVYVYETGTTTLVNVYSDATLSTPAANPLAADSNGEVVFFIGATTALRLDMYTAAGSFIRTIDPVYPAANYTSGGSAAEASIVAAATTDLGSTGSTIVAISGSTTITAFGSSASTASPIYNCRLTGAPLLTHNAASLILPGGVNIQGADGDTFIAEYLGSGNWKVLFYQKASGKSIVPSAVSSGQLQRNSSTQAALMPFKGNQVVFPNGASYTIPSSGLLSGSINGGCNLNGVANSTLSASTLYYVYLWYNSGTPVLDFSTTGHAADATTGIEIKSGDSTRVLAGMIYPQAGPVVVDSASARLVASWHNRQSKYFANAFSADRTLTSASFTEVNSEIRGLFLTWGDAFQCAFAGGYSIAANANPMQFAIGVDGVTTLAASVAVGAITFNGDGWIGAFGGSFAVAEGQHYITLGAKSSTGTITFYSSGNSGLSGSTAI